MDISAPLTLHYDVVLLNGFRAALTLRYLTVKTVKRSSPPF